MDKPEQGCSSRGERDAQEPLPGAFLDGVDADRSRPRTGVDDTGSHKTDHAVPIGGACNAPLAACRPKPPARAFPISQTAALDRPFRRLDFWDWARCDERGGGRARLSSEVWSGTSDSD